MAPGAKDAAAEAAEKPAAPRTWQEALLDTYRCALARAGTGQCVAETGLDELLLAMQGQGS